MTSPFDQAYAIWFVLYIRSAKSNLEMLTFNINLSNVIKHIFNKLKKMEEIMHILNAKKVTMGIKLLECSVKEC